MKANLLLNCSGLNPELISKRPRPDSMSIPCRCRVLTILLLSLTIGIGQMWGATATFTPAASGGWTTTAGAQSGTVSGITVAVTNGRLDKDPNGTEMRFYASATMTISGATITKIEFAHTGGTLSLATGAPGTYDSSTKVWTGSATSISFKNNAQVKFSSIVVTYSTASCEANPTIGNASLNGSFF